VEAYARSTREGGGIELGSSDLSDQACSQRQEASYSLGMVSLGRMTLMLSLRGRTKKDSVRHGYPWVSTDQAHGRPRQVGPAYQKTRQPVSRPNRPSWWPTRPPEDLLEDPPDDLIHHDLKTWRTRRDKTSVDLAQSRLTGYGKMCNLDLGLLVVTDQESRNRPHPLANIRRMRRSLV
jgi:hypothetical protein